MRVLRKIRVIGKGKEGRVKYQGFAGRTTVLCEGQHHVAPFTLRSMPRRGWYEWSPGPRHGALVLILAVPYVGRDSLFPNALCRACFPSAGAGDSPASHALLKWQ